MGYYAEQFKLTMPQWNNMNGTQSPAYVPSPMWQNNNMYSWDSPAWGTYNPIFGNTQSSQPKKELTEAEKREIKRKERREKAKVKQKEELINKAKNTLEKYLVTADKVEQNIGSAVSSSASFIAFEQFGRISHPVSSVKAARSADKLLSLKSNTKFAELWKSNPELAQDIYSNVQSTCSRSNRFFGGILHKKYATGSVEALQLEEYVKNLKNAIENGSTKEIINANETLRVAQKGADGLIIRNAKKLVPDARVVNKTAAITKAAEAAEAVEKSSKLLRYGKEAFKQFKAFAIFDGVIELATKVIPSYIKYGSETGNKQLGQSAVKVTATCAAWGIGRAAGAWAGAKLGAWLGSICCPGIGTAVGAVLGIVGGCFASYFAEKGVERWIPVEAKTLAEAKKGVSTSENIKETIQKINDDLKAKKDVPEDVIRAAKFLSENIQVDVPDEQMQSEQNLNYSA